MPAAVVASVPDTRALTQLFRALGDETRLRIVALLAHGELCVCHVEAALALSQPKVSRHLAVLRGAGVVEARRAGSWIYYRLASQADGERRRQLDQLVRGFAKQATLRDDVKRLVRARGPGTCA
jgi:ArsR family transcriptional regulator